MQTTKVKKMSVRYLILIASMAALISLEVNASAIKGHVQDPVKQHPVKESQVKAAPVKEAAKVVAAAAAPVNPVNVVPVLESSKRVYNDESIRRLAQQPSAPEAVVASESVQQPVAVVGQPVPSQAAAVEVPVVAQQAKENVQGPPQPIVLSYDSSSSLVAPKSSAPVVNKPAEVAEPLPQQSERSVPIKPVEQPVQAPSVVVVEQQQQPQNPIVVKVAEQPAPVVAAQPSVVEPVVVAQKQSSIAQIQPESAIPVVQAAPVQPVVAVVEKKPVVGESLLQAKKDDVAPAVAQSVVVPVQAPVVQAQAPVVQAQQAPVVQQAHQSSADPLHIEVPAPDPQLVLSEPIDSATKLLIDLDEHVQKFLPVEEQNQPAQPAKEPVLVPGVDFSPASSVAANSPSDPSGKSAPLMPYSSSASDESILSLSGSESVDKIQASSGPSHSAPSVSSQSSSPSAARQGGHNQGQNQQQVITQLMEQLDSLQSRITDTINQLVARRRYVMSALLRPMGTYVRRVRTNLERLQNRVNQLQAAATSSVGNGQNRPGGFVDAAAIETIRRRIDDISKRISDIVNRIRFSLTPTSAPMNNNGK